MQAAFSAFPLGEHLNYFCQRFITRSLQMVLHIRPPARAKLFRETISNYERDALYFGVIRRNPAVTFAGSEENLRTVLG